jgi:hypothetical protein
VEDFRCQTLDNRAYAAITACDQLERKMPKAKRQHQGQRLPRALAQARQQQTQAITVADQVRTLAQWLQQDVLTFGGPEATIRCALYDFVTDALAHLEHSEQRIQPVRQRLANPRETLLAFAYDLDRALAELAHHYAVPVETVRALLHGQNQSALTHTTWKVSSFAGRQSLRLSGWHQHLQHFIARFALGKIPLA